MTMIFGVPMPLLASQLVLGLINGSFYALLSLGLAVIFGLMKISNFAHGALFMVGAFCAWGLSVTLGIGYWPALILAPLIVGCLALLLERFVLRRIYAIDHLYGMLLTFGLALVIEGLFREGFGAAGEPYAVPAALDGAINLGFMFLPKYRAWVIVASVVVCFGTWLLIEKTKLGAYLRAATENPSLVSAFGLDVPRMIMLTYGLGVGLAALAGVMAAPIYQVNPTMGSNLIIIVFAVVVIGGMGSILGSVVSGFALGLVEAVTKVYYPPAATTVIFLIMAVVLLIKPAGLFGGSRQTQIAFTSSDTSGSAPIERLGIYGPILLAAFAVAPFLIYPPFVMKVLCFALFAAAFNLLGGYVGLISFGHAAFFGGAGYITAHVMKTYGVTPEIGVLAGTAAATVLGGIFGWLAVRRQGIYFAMVTLALAQMIFFYAVQTPFTGGENGIQGVPRGALLGLVDLDNTYAMYFFVLAVCTFGYLVVLRTIHSPLGHILRGIRENEPRMISLGYSTERYKLLAFVISAGLCGLAGGTKTLVFRLASLTDVEWSMSGEVILIMLLGGLGTLLGPVVGALAVIALESYLASLGAWVTIVQGGIFIACVLFMRRGIVGQFQRFVDQALARRAPNAALAPAGKEASHG